MFSRAVVLLGGCPSTPQCTLGREDIRCNYVLRSDAAHLQILSPMLLRSLWQAACCPAPPSSIILFTYLQVSFNDITVSLLSTPDISCTNKSPTELDLRSCRVFNRHILFLP